MTKKISLVLFLLFIGIAVMYGQPFNPPDGGPAGGPVGVPIDGGISALVAAGAALIGRKFYKDKKKKNSINNQNSEL